MPLNRNVVERAISDFGSDGCTTEGLTNKLNALMRQKGDVDSPDWEAVDVEKYLQIQASAGKWVELVGDYWKLVPVQDKKLDEKEQESEKGEASKPAVLPTNGGKTGNVPPVAEKPPKSHRDTRDQEEREARARKEILECEKHRLFPKALVQGPSVVSSWSGSVLAQNVRGARVIIETAEAIEEDQNHPVYASRNADIVKLQTDLQDALGKHKAAQGLVEGLSEDMTRVERSYWWSKLLLMVTAGLFMAFCVAVPYVPLFARIIGVNAMQHEQKNEESSEETENDDSLRQALEKYKKSQKQE